MSSHRTFTYGRVAFHSEISFAPLLKLHLGQANTKLLDSLVPPLLTI